MTPGIFNAQRIKIDFNLKILSSNLGFTSCEPAPISKSHTLPIKKSLSGGWRNPLFIQSASLETDMTTYIKGSSHYLGDKQDIDVSSKGPSSTNSRRRVFAQNVDILFIALVVRRSFDTFAVIYPLPTLATVQRI